MVVDAIGRGHGVSENANGIVKGNGQINAQKATNIQKRRLSGMDQSTSLRYLWIRSMPGCPPPGPTSLNDGKTPLPHYHATEMGGLGLTKKRNETEERRA